jgi:hypothetical protein
MRGAKGMQGLGGVLRDEVSGSFCSAASGLAQAQILFNFSLADLLGTCLGGSHGVGTVRRL